MPNSRLVGKTLGQSNINTDLDLPCQCGKVISRSLAEAKRRRKRAAKKHGNRNMVRYYECDVAPGVWHWTSMLEPPDLTRFDGDAKVGDNTNTIT